MQLADTAALESQRITRDTSADKKVLRETTQGITKQVALPLATRFSATRLLDMLGRLSPWGRLQETDPAMAQWATTLTSGPEWVLRETTQDITKQVAFPLAMRFTATRLLDLEGRPVRPGCLARLFCSKSFESPIPLSQNMSQSVGEAPGD